MAGADPRRIEHQIRSLPGVVACQFTATQALVLVGPDGDAAAVEAAVAQVLDAAASGLSLNVLAAPRPAAGVTSLGRRRRRKAAFAMAGSAAALSASVAAATTIVVLGGVDLPDATRPTRRTETAAPITLRSEPPVADQLAPRPVRTVAEKLIDAVTETAAPPQAPVTPAAPVAAPVGAAAAPRPVVVAVPLPPALTHLETAGRSVKAAPEPTQVTAAGTAGVSAAGDDHRPSGVARRVRKGNADGPSDRASSVATAAGEKDRKP